MSFIQTIRVQATDEAALRDLLTTWHAEQHGVAPGHQRARLLADPAQPGHYLLAVDFSSSEDAQRNNTRPETATWAEQLRALVDAEPVHTDWRVALDTSE